MQYRVNRGPSRAGCKGFNFSSILPEGRGSWGWSECLLAESVYGAWLEAGSMSAVSAVSAVSPLCRSDDAPRRRVPGITVEGT